MVCVHCSISGCLWFGRWYVCGCLLFFFFSSRRRHTRSSTVSWARRCVKETGPEPAGLVDRHAVRRAGAISLAHVHEQLASVERAVIADQVAPDDLVVRVALSLIHI